MLFSNGLLPYVVLAGPSGWGKTHLLQAAGLTIRKHQGAPVPIHSAAEWLSRSGRLESAEPLLLDDCQATYTSTRLRQQLRWVLERRMRTGRPTMLAFTTEGKNRALRSALPQTRSWTVALLDEPKEAEKEQLIANLAGFEQLSIAPCLVRLIARKAPGNGRTLLGVLQRLKLAHGRWTEPPQILRACGLLYPILGDKHGWDLRDHIHECLQAAWVSDQNGRVAGIPRRKLEIFAMISMVGLGERDVADFFGCSPGEAYTASLEVERVVARGELVDLLVQGSDALLESLETV